MDIGEDWQLVGTDNDGNDGWSTVWDTSEAAPGMYWVRVTVSDAAGHSGDDETEVLVLPRLQISLAQTNVLLSWPAAGANFVVQVNGAVSNPNGWITLTNSVTVTNGQNVVTDQIGLTNRFYRLIQQ